MSWVRDEASGMSAMGLINDRMLQGALETSIVCAQHGNGTKEAPLRVANGKKKRRKPYKPTYYARKEETAMLQDEVARLQARVRELEMAPTPQPTAWSIPLQRSLAENALVSEGIRQSDLALAEMRAALSSSNTLRERNPLTTYIHLTSDLAQRQQTLLALRERKLHDTTEFLLASTRSRDLRLLHTCTDQFASSNGDFGFVCVSVTPLEECSDVRLVFNALRDVVQQKEFVVSELLGFTTTQDLVSGTSMTTSLDDADTRTDPSDDDAVSQYRMLTTHTGPLDVESNMVIFEGFRERSSRLEAPHGLVLVDFVDQDDLHPYLPQLRIRKDVTAATMVRSCAPQFPGEPHVVSFVRSVHCRIHRPQCAGFTAEDGRRLRRELLRWSEVMLHGVRDHLRHQQGGAPPLP